MNKSLNKIEKLIAELCPEGVKWKTLGEVGEFVRGNGLPKSDFTESGVGCIHYGQIYTYYGTSTDKTKSFVSPETAKKLQKVHKNDLIITNTSENIEDVCKTVVWLGNDEIVTGGHASIFKHNENPKYLAYYTQTQMFFAEKRKLAKGTKVIDVSAKDLAKIQIPIPPLAIQQEIVKILDAFATLEAKLEAELEAELEARKKQYEYYREELLTLGDDFEWKTLGDVAYYPKNRRSYATVDNTNYVGVDNLLQNKQGKADSIYVPITGNLIEYQINDVLIGNIRPYLKKIWLSTNNGGTNGDVVVIRINDENKKYVITRYLHFLLSSDDFFEYDMSFAKGAKMPRGNKDAILKYRIPIPPIAEQERIVAILDKFDALVNHISVGLPAELNVRRKQYEYYRNKLLTFKEFPSSGGVAAEG